MDSGAWRATVPGAAKSRTMLSNSAPRTTGTCVKWVTNEACCRARGTPLRALWGPEGEGNPKPRGRVCVRGAESLRFCRNEHSIVKQLCASKNFKKEKLSGKALLECRGEIQTLEQSLWDLNSFMLQVIFGVFQIVNQRGKRTRL